MAAGASSTTPRRPNFGLIRLALEVRYILIEHVRLRTIKLRALAAEFERIFEERPGIFALTRALAPVKLEEDIAREPAAGALGTLRCMCNDGVATSDELVALRAAQLLTVGHPSTVRCVGKVIGRTSKIVRWGNDPFPYHTIVEIRAELLVHSSAGGRILRPEALRRMLV